MYVCVYIYTHTHTYRYVYIYIYMLIRHSFKGPAVKCSVQGRLTDNCIVESQRHVCRHETVFDRGITSVSLTCDMCLFKNVSFPSERLHLASKSHGISSRVAALNSCPCMCASTKEMYA